MLYQEPEAKIFACSQSVYLAEQIAEKYGAQLGKVMASFSLLLKNQLEDCVYSLFALLFLVPTI